MAAGRPTRADLEAARGRGLRDVWPAGVRVVFCGINPSLYSAATGHHFARPGNRFWAALHRGGFTDRELTPYEDAELPEFGCGVTNLVNRATARADELSRQELCRGARLLRQVIARRQPEWLAVVGVTAFRTAFGRRAAEVGEQGDRVGGARVWVLPNPSGINVHYQLDDLARLFGELRRKVSVGSG